MKSYINVLVDYRETPFEKEAVISCSPEYVQNQMKHLTRIRKKTVDVDVIEKGDVVSLSLESEIEKFNRPNVFMTIGSGLFDAEFEQMLIGHKSGDAFDATVQEKTVKVTVKQATRTIFPEPTDEMALQYGKEHDGFEGIQTIEDYRNRIIDNYIEEKRREIFYDAMDEIQNYVLTHSDWEFDDGEIQECVNAEKKHIDMDVRREAHKSMNDLSEEELQIYFGVSTFEELDEFLTNGSEQRIALVLWVASVNGVDTTTASLYELEEELDWKFLENFIEENLKITEER